jgi:KDO2-lipid IV(A) lauroyltransferase
MSEPRMVTQSDPATVAAKRPRGAWLVDAVFLTAGCIPLPVAVFLGRALGWLLAHVLRFRRKVVSAQIVAAFPEWTPERRRGVETAFYRHLGLLFMEMIRLPRTSPEFLLKNVTFHGREHAEAALAKGRGVLVLGGHFGSWELALASGTPHRYNIGIVFKEIKGALGQYAIDRIRGTHGVLGIPRRNSIFQILRQLRKNGMIGFVLDQNVTADEGVFVEFFGRQACTMPGLAVIAQRTGAPVVPVVFYRDPGLRRHHIEFLPELPWEEIPGNPEETLRLNTARYTKVLEEFVRRHPDQWMWLHKRWKTQPPAATS